MPENFKHTDCKLNLKKISIRKLFQIIVFNLNINKLMKKLFNILGRIAAILSIVFISVTFNKHFNEIPDFNLGIWVMLSFILAVTLFVMTIAISAYIWVILLRGDNVFITLRQSYIIMGQAQIGKYLPGNIFHYLGRFNLGKEFGIPTKAILISIGAETLLSIMTAAIVASFGLFFNKKALEWLLHEMDTNGVAKTLVAIVLLFAIFLIVSILVPQIKGWIRQYLGYLHIKRICISVVLIILVFGVYGNFISLLLRTIWEVNTGLQWYQFTWGFALAWVLGFIVPGAPGGIGIREVVFVGLYGQELGEGMAIGLAVVVRLVTSFGDLFAFGLAYWLGKQGSIATLEKN